MSKAKGKARLARFFKITLRRECADGYVEECETSVHAADADDAHAWGMTVAESPDLRWRRTAGPFHSLKERGTPHITEIWEMVRGEVDARSIHRP